MPVIAVASKKGGSGKTTLATNIADALDAEGWRVLLVDADPQRSALTWAANGSTAPAVVGSDAGLSNPKRVPAWAQDYDWVVIDCPPRHGAELRAALAVADLVLVPVRPSPGDIEVLWQTITELKDTRPDVLARAVLNQRSARSSYADAAPEAIKAAGLEVLATEVGTRADFVDAHAAGCGVVRLNPKSKAAAEIRLLIEAIRALVAPPTPAKRKRR